VVTKKKAANLRGLQAHSGEANLKYRRINTRDSANSVFSTRSLYVFSYRNSGSAKRSATRVGKTEEARVFRENFYGGKLFQCLNKKDKKNSKKATCQVEFFKKKRRT
jgi:hypothetical protein|tara:strand:+ start:91 stop:411 length:321 start_codon:yes stop_codon:yes gene_type:complete